MAASFQPMSHMTTKHEHSAESRSTSADSNEGGADLCRQGQGRASSSSINSALPQYEYPVTFVVRNTFIDAEVVRPLSLDDFFQERRIHSCPVATAEEDSHLEEIQEEVPTAQPLRRAVTAGAQALMTNVATATGFWPAPEQRPSQEAVDNFYAQQSTPRVLMLSEALPEPIPGSAEMPTIGSVGHSTGSCKPCAFFYTRGCENGAQCSFCHLCPADEKRKRQKEKLAAFRGMRQQRRQVRL